MLKCLSSNGRQPASNASSSSTVLNLARGSHVVPACSENHFRVISVRFGYDKHLCCCLSIVDAVHMHTLHLNTVRIVAGQVAYTSRQCPIGYGSKFRFTLLYKSQPYSTVDSTSSECVPHRLCVKSCLYSSANSSTIEVTSSAGGILAHDHTYKSFPCPVQKPAQTH